MLWVTLLMSRREMSSRELELLLMFLLVRRFLDVLLMLWVTPLMARDLLDARRDTELVSRLLESSPDNLSRSPCRLVSRLWTAWCPLVVVRESWSLVTDRLARLLSPSTPSSTRRGSTTLEMPRRSCTASTLPWVRRDQPWLRLSRD